MWNLLNNYLRDQKNNWLQVIGLGFLVIIMIGSFLSLTFGANYVNDNYKDKIAGEFHQEVRFTSDWNPSFRRRNIENTWLENLNYITREEGSTTDYVDEEKILNATFQLQQLPEYNESTNDYLYRFYFEDEANHIHVGQNFAKKTKHNYVDFKLTLPGNYPTVEKHNEFVKQQADIINRFVYNPNLSDDPDNDANKTNFFIVNTSTALNHYKTEIQNQEKYPYAKRDYKITDISALSKLYYFLTLGMLWGDNVGWDRAIVINDLLISGKTFAFVQTTSFDQVNTPVLVSPNNGVKFNPKNLNDDEILIYQEFAKENNLKIGQDYFFSGYKFKIVGFATSAFSANNNYYFNGISDNKNQTVAFVNQETFEKVLPNPFTKEHSDYFITYNPERAAKQIAPKINNDWVYQYFHDALVNNHQINKTYLYGIDNGIDTQMLFGPLSVNVNFWILENWVWATLQQLTNIFVEIASVFLVLIFIVASVIIFIVVFKMIDRNKQLIGILKANGYESWKLSVVLVASIVFPIILFALIAVGLSVIISHFIVVAYSAAMMLVNYGFPFYWLSSLLVVIIPIIVLFLISVLLVNILLRVDALTLIHNSWAKTKYHFNISHFFKNLSTKVIKNVNFQNKLAITTTFRSFGKVIFVSLVSVFASTLLLFSLSASGLVNNMLGLQFASVNYRFNSQYKFSSRVYNNFVNINSPEKQLLYKKESAQDIIARDSLYNDLIEKIEEVIKNPSQSTIFDFRYGYLRGSEMYEIRKNLIEPNLESLPPAFQKFWNDNIYWIDYLTNNNGQSDSDLILNFGLLPYDENMEAAYTQMYLSDSHDFNIDTIDTNKFYFDNEYQIFVGDWSKLPGTARTVQGVSVQSSRFLNPGLRNSNFRNFGNLTLDSMKASGNWLNTNFLFIREAILKNFNIQPNDNSSVSIVPMIGSTVAGLTESSGGDGNHLGKTVLYRYTGLTGREQYIIGVIYDGARNLLPGTVLMPNEWLNESLFNINDEIKPLVSDFATSKFTNFPNNELWQYLPIISEKNDYQIDLSRVAESGYLENVKGMGPGLDYLYDVNSVKAIMQAQQYMYQVLIMLFAVFSVFLSFMIVIIISNINIRDNLILINILRSLGYSSPEVSYIFLVIMMPLLVIFSLFSVLIAPILTNFLANSLIEVVRQQIPIIFLWWYYAIPIFIIVLIYLLSFIITWKLNVNNRQLMNLTK